MTPTRPGKRRTVKGWAVIDNVNDIFKTTDTLRYAIFATKQSVLAHYKCILEHERVRLVPVTITIHDKQVGRKSK